MDIEHAVERLRDEFGLSSVHIFDELQFGKWRVFAFRKDPKGFQASCAEGCGNNIAECLADLWDSLRIGPVKAAEKKEEMLRDLARSHQSQA
jgi:hypothetical protein